MATYPKRFNFFVEPVDEEILDELACKAGVSKAELLRQLIRNHKLPINANKLYELCKEVVEAYEQATSG